MLIFIVKFPFEIFSGMPTAGRGEIISIVTPLGDFFLPSTNFKKPIFLSRFLKIFSWGHMHLERDN